MSDILVWTTIRTLQDDTLGMPVEIGVHIVNDGGAGSDEDFRHRASANWFVQWDDIEDHMADVPPAMRPILRNTDLTTPYQEIDKQLSELIDEKRGENGLAYICGYEISTSLFVMNFLAETAARLNFDHVLDTAPFWMALSQLGMEDRIPREFSGRLAMNQSQDDFDEYIEIISALKIGLESTSD